MLSAPLPTNESQRLAALHRYHILDTPPDPAFDEVADLAAEICETPIALVSLVDESRQWFKARIGLAPRETARSVAFCAHAILQDDVFIVPDTYEDPRFADNPLVTGDPNIRFYAGAPLFAPDGNGLGTLCVIDKRPRNLTSQQRKALLVLRQHVLNLMELRRQNAELRGLAQELDAFAYSASHDLIAPIRRIVSFCRVLKEDFGDVLEGEGERVLERVEKSALDMRDLIEGLLALSRVSRAELNTMRVDLSKMAQDVLAELKESDPERNVEVRVAPDLSAYGDHRLIRTALVNLLNNAWKFTAKRGAARIEVGQEQRGQEMWFFVKDNGAGFNEDVATDIFSPFKRLHCDEEFSGTGIGLAIVRRVFTRHGGEVIAKGVPGEGATFYFRL